MQGECVLELSIVASSLVGDGRSKDNCRQGQAPTLLLSFRCYLTSR